MLVLLQGSVEMVGAAGRRLKGGCGKIGTMEMKNGLMYTGQVISPSTSPCVFEYHSISGISLPVYSPP